MTMALSISPVISFVVIVSFAVASAYFYNLNHDKERRKGKCDKKEVHDVLFFALGDKEYKKSKYSRCMITQTMDRLLFYLSTPRYTLDICMYVFTNWDVANIVMKLHHKGVKIRVIIDADMAYSSNSTTRRLEKLGIPVRWTKSTNLMHHKFCLIDASSESGQTQPLVITGSLNWTNQAIYGNWENVLVTSHTEILEQYKAAFENLWIKFKPVV